MLTIKLLRKKIERIDAGIIKKLGQREAISKQIGHLKLQEGLGVVDSVQEQKLTEYHNKLCEQYQLPPEFVQKLFQIIIGYSRMIQK